MLFFLFAVLFFVLLFLNFFYAAAVDCFYGNDRFTDHHQRFAQSHASIIGGHNADCLLFERPGLIRSPSVHGGIAEQVRSNVAPAPIR